MKRRRSAIPLTGVGMLACGLGVTAYVAGWQLGWVELMVVAAGCLLALAIAVPFVIGRMRLEVDRTIDPPRVKAGDRAIAVLDVRNPGPGHARPRIIEDAVSDRFVRIEVPMLGEGERYQTLYSLPTAQRGAMTIGPAVIAKQDPLHLMRREVRHTDEQPFWVHPRWVTLPALPVGFAKDLEGPTSDTSPAGDVAFHALREYQLGDDFRHIHWMSTARTNTPMVRHYVDNRKPQLLVTIDDRAAALDGAQYEVALEIAASLVVSSSLHHEKLAMWTTAGPLAGRSTPGSCDDVLDRLAAAQPNPNGDIGRTATVALRTETGTSALMLITGGLPASELLVIASQARRSVRVLIVRVWPEGAVEPGIVPGARVLDIDSRDGFERIWRSVVT